VQFDIHRNPGPRTAGARPFLLVVQSDRHAPMESRLVVTLVVAAALPVHRFLNDHLVPMFRIAEREVFLNPFEITHVAVERLGEPIARLDDEEDQRRVQRALDDVLAHY
jgi:mRNA-degrading endonuclease toxin of MazEF toxin-antitoxin module